MVGRKRYDGWSRKGESTKAARKRHEREAITIETYEPKPNVKVGRKKRKWENTISDTWSFPWSKHVYYRYTHLPIKNMTDEQLLNEYVKLPEYLQDPNVEKEQHIRYQMIEEEIQRRGLEVTKE